MKDFEKVIWRQSLVLIDFFATWCGPCQMMHPVLDRFREQMVGRVDVFKIDIDSLEDAETVRRYNIQAVPTLIFFRRGRVLWRGSGRLSLEQLREVVERIEEKEYAACKL